MVEIARYKPITKAQIKSIHVALSRHGIDDDTYRAKLDAMFGVDSCKQLSRRDASTLLKSLGCKLKNRPGHYGVNNNPPVIPAKAGTQSTAMEGGSADYAGSRHLPNTNPAKLDTVRGVRGGASNPREPKKLPAGVVSLPSLPQRRFIADLIGEIKWRVNNGYQYWLKKNMGLTCVATASQAGRVIEGLKALKAHQAA